MTSIRIGIIVLLLSFTGCKEDESIARKNTDRSLAFQPAQRAFLCQDIKPLIPVGGSAEGKTCPENKTVINGWSETCVAAGQCNTPVRLGEINKAAEEFCADWCRRKNCDYKYTKRDKCDSSWCLNSKDCQANCGVPLLDTCYFQQAAPNYNCQCQEKVQG